MLRIRLIEEAISLRYKNGQMRCPVHLSIGQEAASVGIANNLEFNSRAFSNHRCHSHYLSMGGSLKKMLCEIHGKSGGTSNGRGGSMHLADPSKGLVASIPIVSSSIPLAVGTSLSDKINNKKNVSVAFFGDASVEEGIFHESLNFASLQNLPVIFVCENNLYSVYSHLNLRQPKRDFKKLAEAHKVKFLKANGNNVEEVYKISKKAVNYCKKNGPVMFYMETYRFLEHCGPNEDDHLGYRKKGELKKWLKKCPIKIYTRKLKRENIITDEKIKNLKNKIMKEIDKNFTIALKNRLPKSREANKYVYA